MSSATPTDAAAAKPLSPEQAVERTLTKLRYIFAVIAVVALVVTVLVLVVRSISSSAPLVGIIAPVQALVTQFALAFTHNDVADGQSLFTSRGTASLHTLFVELAPGNQSVQSQYYESHMAVLFGTYLSTFMTLSNVDVTQVNSTFATALAVGYVQRTVDTVVAEHQTHVSYAYSFSMYFEATWNKSMRIWQLQHVQSLANATKLDLDNVAFRVGAPEGPIQKKRGRSVALRDLESDQALWFALQTQINNLVARNQKQDARYLCATPFYLALKDIFDAQSTDTTLYCNTPDSTAPAQFVLSQTQVCIGDGRIDASCFGNMTEACVSTIACIAGTDLAERIKTINSINPVSPSLDFTITGGPGIQVEGGANGITITNSLKDTLNLPPELFFDGYYYLKKTNQTPNTFWAGPVDGTTPAPPTFRALVAADLPPIDITYTLELSAGLASEFNISGSPFTGSSGTITLSKAPQQANSFWAGPVAGAAAEPTFRTFAASDLAALGLADGQLVIGSTGNAPVVANLVAGANVVITNMPGEIIISTSINGTAIGTVMSVGLNLPTSVFSISGSPVTSMGTLTGSFVAQAINAVFAGPASGASDVPTFRALGFPDLPPMESIQVWMGAGPNNITAGSGLTITFGSGLTTFTVTLVMPVSIFNVVGDVNGPTTVTLVSQSANTFLAAPSGASGVPSFRTFTAADLTSLGMTDGQLVIGSTGGTPVLATLVAGANVVITNMPGEIIISTSINGSAIGTVMSVGLDLPASVFSISGSPVTSMGTLTGSFVAQAINTVFAGPVGGVAGVPTFRSLGFPDLPPMTSMQVWMGDGANTITAGSGLSITFGTGLTTFTVTLVMPVSVFSVSGAVGGSTTVSFVSQSANTFLAAPSGSSGVPSFRTMTLADLPGTLGNGQLYIGNAGTAVVSTLTAGTRITITPGPGTLTVSTTAEANTASNVGVGAIGGVGIFKQKTGEDLEFYGINKASTKISIALNGATNEIDLDVVPSNIDHNALLNYVSNQHIDHSTVSILPGTGLTGGGDLTATRTLNLADTTVYADTYGSSTMIPVLTIDAQGRITNASNVLMVDMAGESNTASNVNTEGVGVFKQKSGIDFEFRGISAGSNKTIVLLDTPNNAISVDIVPSNVNHNALYNYVYSEHIDHSFVSITPGTGLAGGGDLTATRTLNLADTTVVADTYGSATMVPVITIDAQGRITNATNVLMVDVTGEANTASNVNVGGVGVFKQKTGVDLEFRGIIAGSTKANVALDAPNNVISVDVVPANIDHNALLNYVSNQHIDHSAVSITPGTGLTGGGDLTATRTLNLADTTVVADTYGSTTMVPVLTIDAQGRITNATNVLMVDVTGESNTASNVNVGGVGVFKQKAGIDLEFRGIIAGSTKANVALDAPNNVISVDVVPANIDHNALLNYVSNQHIDHSAVSITPGTGLTGGGDLTATRTLNLADTTVVADTYGSTTMIPVITIDAQGRITNATNVLMVDVTGESNTASNVNVGGVGVFKQKTGVDLEFRGIRADSNKTTVTLDMANNAISIDVVPSNIDHNALLNYVANKHIDHSAVSIVAGTGLTGGGDLTATRTLDLADTTVVADTYGSSTMIPIITVDAQGRITNVTTLSIGGGFGESNTASNVNTAGVGVFKQKTGVDLEFRGISAGSSKTSVVLDTPNNAISVDVVPANIDHDALLNYVANKHIDHSAVSITPGTGLTGGGDLTTTRTLTLADTAVTPATYGSATMIPVIIIDQQGRITGASNVAATGEANTASNVNVGGVGVFKQKTSVDLEFRGIIGGSNKTSVTLDAPNNVISVDVVTANIDHNALFNYASAEHVDHTTVSITAGTGLTGGGTIAATRTLNLADTAVTPATYGSATLVPVLVIDQQGRITGASTTAVTSTFGALTIDSYASPTPTTTCVVAGGATLNTENPIILTRQLSTIATWNFETNAAVSLGTDSWPDGGINRIFFSPNGTLYGLGCADANFFCTRGLLLIDAVTQQTQSVVCTISTLAGFDKTAGMAFLNDTHVYIASDIDYALYLLDITTCTSNLVYAGISTGASATTLMTMYRSKLYIATFRSAATGPPATILAYDTTSNTIVNTLANSGVQGGTAIGLYTYCSPNGPTLMIGSLLVTTVGQLQGICQFDERTGATYRCRRTPSLISFTSYCPTTATLVSKSTCFHGDIDMTDQYSIININFARAKLVEADTLVANTISGNQTTSAIVMRTNRLILVTADSITGYLQLGQNVNLYSPSASVLQTNVTTFRIYTAVSSFSSSVTSLDCQPQITAAVTGTVTSIAASNAIASVLAGTYSSMIGVSARAVTATAAATSTVTLATAFQVLWNVYGAGPITIVTQIGLDVPTTAGLCTNAYGIRLGAPTGGTAINNALNFLAGTTPAGGITFGADALPRATLYRSAAQVVECDATLSSVYKLSLLGAVASAIGSKAGVSVISNTVAGSTITSAVAYQATPFSAAGMTAATIVTTATGFQVVDSNLGSGPAVLTTHIGVDVPALAATATNAYGLRLAAPTGGTAINNALNFVAGTTPAAGITFGADALPQANLYRSASQVLETDATLSSVYKLSLFAAVANAIGSKAGVAVISNTVAGSTITNAVAYQATPFSAAGMSAATIVTTATGFQVANNALGTGPAVVGTQIGLDVPALTVASTNAYGVRLAAPTGGSAINNALNFVVGTTAAAGITFGADALPQANLYRSAAQVLETDATLSSVYKLSLLGAVASAIGSKAGVSVISNTVAGSTITNAVAYQATPFSAAGMSAATIVTTATGFQVANNALGTGPAVVGTQIGVDVPALTVASTNAYGIRLAAPTGGTAINNALNFVAGTTAAAGITFGADALPQANLYRSATQVLETDATLSSVYKLSLNGAVASSVASKAGVAVISNTVGSSALTAVVAYQATPFSAAGMTATPTVTTATGFQVVDSSLGTGPAVLTTHIGVDVPALAATATNAYGMRLAAPTGGSTINNALNFVAGTTAAAGITFGADAAPSVNLYRSAANMLKTDTDLTVRHVVPSNPSIPTVATGTGAGTTGPAATATITAGSTDCKMQVTVVTGNSCTASATIITVTYNSAFTGTVNPGVVFSPANAAAAARSSTSAVFIGAETLTTFTLTAGTVALANGVTYIWNFQVCS